MTRRRPDLAGEQGIALLVVLMALAAGSALAAVVLSAAGADLPFAKASQDRKQAYASAEAGLEYYMFQLSENNDYWTLCDTAQGPTPSEPNPVNQAFKRTSSGQPDPRRWRKMPDGKSQYTIELLPATATGTCTAGPTAHESMLNGSSGTFRIRATGRAGNVTRSIVTTLRRKSFLDYIYFTDYETRDPAQYPNPNDAAWAAINCAKPRASRPSGCQAIQFADADEINGPFHTNDNMLTCGTPKFGRTKDDRIESGNGWVSAGCGGSPDFQGTWMPNADALNVPPTNAGLASVAVPQYTYTGKTTIRLNGTTMDVTTGTPAVTTTNVPFPANGVIYVNNGACSGTKTPLLQRYDDPVGCAVVYLSGTYSKSLTIASANDIVVTGDVRKNADADVVLGLIANNNVRIYHPVTRSDWNNPDSCTNATGSMTNVTIDAAILALTHSFVVDNFRCGAGLGTLNVTGAIAQKFRGAVGTPGPPRTGYVKNYVYDDRLKYRSPPYFLDPVQAAWKVNRSNEQVPAAR
jgi:Tfp pilus assembly protein PilX